MVWITLRSNTPCGCTGLAPSEIWLHSIPTSPFAFLNQCIPAAPACQLSLLTRLKAASSGGHPRCSCGSAVWMPCIRNQGCHRHLHTPRFCLAALCGDPPSPSGQLPSFLIYSASEQRARGPEAPCASCVLRHRTFTLLI